MGAPSGNKFWEARSKHGRKPLWESPDDMWEACVEYFEWVEKNPLWESKLFNNQGELVEGTIPKMRAMTLGGLCVFLGVARSSWDNYREKEDFLGVVDRAEEIIKEQKFAGASAGLLNANIIARDLGLTDKKEVEHSVDEGMVDRIKRGRERNAE